MIEYDRTPRPTDWRKRCQWADRRDQDLKQQRARNYNMDTARDLRSSKFRRAFGQRENGQPNN